MNDAANQEVPSDVALKTEALLKMAEIHNLASIEWDRFSGWLLTASAASVTFLVANAESLGASVRAGIPTFIRVLVFCVVCGVVQKLLRTLVLMRHAGMAVGGGMKPGAVPHFIAFVGSLAGLAKKVVERSLKDPSPEKIVRSFSRDVQLQFLFTVAQAVAMIIAACSVV